MDQRRLRKTILELIGLRNLAGTSYEHIVRRNFHTDNCLLYHRFIRSDTEYGRRIIKTIEIQVCYSPPVLLLVV